MNWILGHVDLFAFALSIFALIISYMSNRKTNAFTKTATSLQCGQVEMQMREMISSAMTRYEDVISKEYKNDNMRVLLENAALERICNAYDEACAKYLDAKVDKDRFWKLYFDEICQWVENERVGEKYNGPQTKFNATVKVHKLWRDRETTT